MTPVQYTILQLGHPGLRQSAQPIDDIRDPNLQGLIDDLLHTLTEAGGVGIAAPQAGMLQQLVIVASRPTSRYPHAPEMPPTPMINPTLTAYSAETVKGWEGCLSVPGLRGLVPRYQSVTVDYLDRWGNAQQHTFRDFMARVVQHELDHLQGIVFVDRVESTTELMTEQEYQRQIEMPAQSTSDNLNRTTVHCNERLILWEPGQ